MLTIWSITAALVAGAAVIGVWGWYKGKQEEQAMYVQRKDGKVVMWHGDEQ